MNASTRRAASGALFFCLALVGCQGAPIEGPIEGEEGLAAEPLAQAKTGGKHTCFMVAHLDGDQEVPHRSTSAFGLATLQLNQHWKKLSFELVVGDIENVTAAHIHLGAPGHNGPVVAQLYGPRNPGGGPKNGVLRRGSISASRLVGPLEDMTLAALVEELNDGGAYINVHTDDGHPPPDTGEGDFPNGEIRGQIELLGPCGDE